MKKGHFKKNHPLIWFSYLISLITLFLGKSIIQKILRTLEHRPIQFSVSFFHVNASSLNKISEDVECLLKDTNPISETRTRKKTSLITVFQTIYCFQLFIALIRGTFIYIAVVAATSWLHVMILTCVWQINNSLMSLFFLVNTHIWILRIIISTKFLALYPKSKQILSSW